MSRNLSVLCRGGYKLHWDEAKRVDRACTEATEVKKEKDLGGGQIFTRELIHKFSSLIGV